MRLIDADALKKKIITTLCDFIACGNCPFYEETCLVGDWIDDAPTIDAVPQEEVVEIKNNYIDEISGLLNRIDELTIEKCDIPHSSKPQTDLISQSDSLIIADALRYLAKDEERHLSDRTRADALRQQILKHGASMCKTEPTDLISRADAIEAAQAIIGNEASSKAWAILEQIRSLPSADAKEGVIYYEGKSYKGGNE